MNTDMPAFTSRERTLIAKEIQFLEKLLNLLNVGKPGVRQARREIAQRLGIYRMAEEMQRIQVEPNTGRLIGENTNA